MSKINLLPWREAKRKELQNQFVLTLVTVALFAVAVWGAIRFYHIQLIDRQNQRIALIEQNISQVDKKIEEIKQLEKEKEKLLARISAIEELQANRPLIVRLFDELVTSLPDGVSIDSVEQKGTSIIINGIAESNARVSSFMRNLENSEWLANPDLKIIQAVSEKDKQINNFILRFLQIIPKAVQEDEI